MTDWCHNGCLVWSRIVQLLQTVDQCHQRRGRGSEGEGSGVRDGHKGSRLACPRRGSYDGCS